MNWWLMNSSIVSKLAPEFKPIEKPYRPDMSFIANGVKFIVDVFATASPQKSVRRLANGLYESVDTSRPGQSRAHKVAERVPVGGILLPDEQGRTHYNNIAAVIACDWFDTLSNDSRERRLHCVVLHNWAGALLPAEAFKDFPQVLWTETRRGVWRPRLTRDGNIVARFTEDDRLELKPYSPNTPR
jgi:hypothetical protein